MKRRLIDWALRVGHRVSELRQAGKPIPAGLAAQHRIADKLVYSKVKARLGGRMRAVISGAAPLAKEIAEFFLAIDVLILEGYGQTEGTTAATQPAGPLPVRHGRPRAAERRGPSGRRRRDPPPRADGLRRLLRKRGSDARGAR